MRENTACLICMHSIYRRQERRMACKRRRAYRCTRGARGTIDASPSNSLVGRQAGLGRQYTQHAGETRQPTAATCPQLVRQECWVRQERPCQAQKERENNHRFQLFQDERYVASRRFVIST